MERVEETARRLEEAQAAQNAAYGEATARANPSGGAGVLRVGGGRAIAMGPGSPLSQAVGLLEALSEPDLDRIEEFLGRPTQIELTPFAHPSLAPLLGRRGYRVAQWQQMLARPLETAFPDPVPGVEVAPLQPGEEEIFARTVMGAFRDQDLAPLEDCRGMLPATAMEGNVCVVARIDGEVAGGATVGIGANRAAILAGAGVRPQFRGQGVQRALVRKRLELAREAGCDVAGSSTLPATASQRNLEKLGFRILYPKLVMVRDPEAPAG